MCKAPKREKGAAELKVVVDATPANGKLAFQYLPEILLGLYLL